MNQPRPDDQGRTDCPDDPDSISDIREIREIRGDTSEIQKSEVGVQLSRPAAPKLAS
jgi:hypothetical protein